MHQNIRALLTKRFHVPRERIMEKAVRRFTLAEKALFYFFTGLFILSGVILIWKTNNAFLVDVPLRGGSVTEGVIGNPRFINPVLAISEADKSLVSLVYSGLLRVSPDGSLINDLAESVTVSEDGLTYTVLIRPDAKFHDGESVTADDIIFTIGKIQDPAIKSPLFSDFAGIGAEKKDEHTVVFTLRRPFAPFMESLSLGILPKHVWSTLANEEFSFSQWNVLPVGSGPYRVETVERDSGGIPDYYELVPFEDGSSRTPYISRYVFRFFPTEADLIDAYDSGDIQIISGISPKEARLLADKGAKITSSTLPRVFGVFFNQNMNKALLDQSARRALNMAAPKREIVERVLSGYGTVLGGPIPPGLVEIPEDPNADLSAEERLTKAKEILADGGWKLNEDSGLLEKKSKTDTLKLSLSLSTSDNPELKAVAEMIRIAWQELGVQVETRIYETGDLNQNVIRPRRYDALLFGEVVGRELDVYPFWHSSERNDPGLNIAMYANSQVDKLLTSIRTESDAEEREEAYADFEEAVREDVPAVFLYSPSFIYVMPKSVKGVALGRLGTPQDRFLGIRDWYIETNSVWNIFANR